MRCSTVHEMFTHTHTNTHVHASIGRAPLAADKLCAHSRRMCVKPPPKSTHIHTQNAFSDIIFRILLHMYIEISYVRTVCIMYYGVSNFAQLSAARRTAKARITQVLGSMIHAHVRIYERDATSHVKWVISHSQSAQHKYACLQSQYANVKIVYSANRLRPGCLDNTRLPSVMIACSLI